MSNFEAAKLFESVIEEVISDSRQDFEDSGIDESTLQELRKIWCQRLSAAGVAKFSWDELAFQEEQRAAAEAAQLQTAHDGTGIISAGDGLQGKYDFGSADRFALSDANGLNNFDATGGLELPNINGGAPQVTDLLYNQASPGGDASGSIQIPGMDNLPKTEDVSESTGLMFPRIGQADGTIEFTMDLGQDEAANIFKSIQKKGLSKEATKNSNDRSVRIGQADGADDFDDDDDVFNDSDDINSDLDDEVESDREDDDVGQDEGQIMLCLYDKVQRIKNKWKSTLKEGVANINGRDYVFQKATGESEW